MGKNQGLYRIKKGIERRLTKSEVKRGYLFISVDRSLKELINTDNFTLEIDGKELESRKIDKYGRVQIPRNTLREIGLEKEIIIEIASKDKMQIRT